MNATVIDNKWLDDLESDVLAHPAVNHLLLARAATHPYTRTDYKVFGLQHHALVGFFTRYMEVLLLRAPSSAEKLWLAKVLVDEYGEGSNGDDHATLYRDFVRRAGGDDAMMNEVALAETTSGFVLEHLRIVSEEPFLVGLGALGPGHEWAIPTMFTSLIPQLESAGFSRSDIDYFLLHCEQDIDHAAWMTESLQRLVVSESDRDLVRRGAKLSLAARERLWDGIERIIAAGNGPAAGAAAGRRLGDLPRDVTIGF